MSHAPSPDTIARISEPRAAARPRDARRGAGVLIVVPWDQTFGGVTSVARNLARYLEEGGHRPVFLLPGPSTIARPGRSQLGFAAYFQTLRQPLHAHVPVKSVVSFLAHFPLTLWELVRLVRRERIEVVNVHYPGENALYFALLPRLLGVRLVTSVHGSDVIPEEGRPLRHPLGMRALFAASDAIVAPSAAFRETFLADFPQHAAKTVVVWNGIVTSEFDRHLADADPAAIAECAEVTGGAPYVLTIADQTPKKALDVLIRAFPRVAATHPGLSLLLVGDPRLRGELEALAREVGVADRLRIVERRPPPVVARLLRDARAFVLPSRAEPFGIAAVEALALGAPTIVTAVEGLREVVRDGETGLQVPPEDPDALAGAMLRVLDDEPLRRRLTAAGRDDARRRFDWRATGAAYLRDALRLPDPAPAPR